MNRQVDFAYDIEMVFLKKKVIRKDAAGDGILNSHHCKVSLATSQALAQKMKREALDRIDRLRKVGQRSYLMKARSYPLNCNL